MKNISIRTRLYVLFIVIMLILSVSGYFGIEKMAALTNLQMKKIDQVNTISSDALRATIQFKKQVQEWKDILLRGHNPQDYKKYRALFEKQSQSVIQAVKKLIQESKDYPELQQIARQFLSRHQQLNKKYQEALSLLKAREDGLGYREVDARVRGIDRLPSNMIESIKDLADQIKTGITTKSRQNIEDYRHQFLIVSGGLFVVFAALYLVLNVILIDRSILKPVHTLSEVVQKIQQGDYSARSHMTSQDEIGLLGQSFDALLDERLETQIRLEKESEQLNASIIGLLKAVSVLSNKDLRVHIPVSEDITGAVSDAINQLASETAQTLLAVNRVAARVSDSSENIKAQSHAAIELAQKERHEIESMVDELKHTVESMLEVAQFTEMTQQSSEAAMSTTDSALHAVTDTVHSIDKIRDIVRQTEKRIKQLGERSQEIGVAVNLINDIAERTHILALNSGIQAAQAGEAGKGFMVVANEVQRLAESARDATDAISGLVKNIQVDTSDTMVTMNSVISQVVEGTKQAELAGERMQETRDVTRKLVASVHQIAQRTQNQLDLNTQLQNRSETIKDMVSTTHRHLQQQLELADDLAGNASDLVASVHVFKLPAA